RSSSKPTGLVERRQDCQFEHGTGIVPHTVVVGCRDVESVLARRQIAVEGLPASARILPLLISALELVPEAHFLRAGEAQRGVADLDVVTSRGKANKPANGVVFPVGSHFLYVDG